MNDKVLENIRPVMQKEIDNGSIHGSAIRIIHNNRSIYEEELGYADKENQVPIKKDTIYRMYSMTKPVTAVAAMILYERGQLDLFAPVSDYLEGFKNQKVWSETGIVEVNRPVTIQHLLNMTSGVVYPDASFPAGKKMDQLYTQIDKECKEGKPVPTIEFCNRIGKEPLEFQPGERWRYGASADILGGVIEVISGKTLGQFLQDEIFSPLGMIDSGFYVPKDKLNRFAKLYEFIAEEVQLKLCTWNFLAVGDYDAPPAFESGGAGLVSTIDDYSKFAMMLANGGTYQDTRILGPKTVDYLSKPQLNSLQTESFNWEQLRGYSYGNLMRVLVDPAAAASNGNSGEFGWDGWTGNYFFIDPKENLIMIYMIQKCAGSNHSLIRSLRSIIYSALN